ncbi:MAG: hypothetical protein HYY06_27460 [Deltaproteobacteria bacterium]|nr:hypothetical protein [Deltaproteobacteria bacterium]
MSFLRLVPVILAAFLISCISSGRDRKRDGGRERSATDGGRPAACACEDRWRIEPAGRDVPGTGGTPEPGGTMVVHADSEPPHFNYMLKPDAMATWIAMHDVLETLVRLDPRTLEIVPELAERWEVSDEGKTITFHLRSGVEWHDGRPFSSADVAFTFDRLMDPNVLAAAQRADFENVDRWEAPDERTFVLRLKWVHFATMPNLDHLQILPRHVFARGDFNNHPANRAPVGTGPFVLDHWTPGDEIVLVKNRRYWGRPAWLDRVIYRVVRDRSVAFEMCKRGEIDLMWRLLPEQVADQLDPELLSRYNLVQYWPFKTAFWVYNTRRPFFREARVRRALTMLIDRDMIRCSVERCLSRVVGQLYPPEQPVGQPPIPPIPFDPERAKAILDEAGWRDSDGDGVRDKRIDGKLVPFRFTFLATAGSTSLQRQAAIVQNELRRAGIDMDIQQTDWVVFSERLREHEFDAGSLLWVFDSPAIDLFSIFHSSQASGGGVNYGAWRHAEADRILDEARHVLDASRRNAMYHRLSELVAEEQPYTVMLNQANNSLVSKRLHGVYTSIAWYQERDVWIPRAEQ